MVNDERFQLLFAAADDDLKPVVLVAFDTGLRKDEILDLRWTQVDLAEGCLRLAPQDTKGEEHRPVYFTKRLAEARAKQHEITGGSEFVFVNPETGTRWKEIRRKFAAACKGAGLDGLWFHDLRRSFVTEARRSGTPESVVMRMSGHRTRAVFDRYNIVCEDDLKEAVRRLDARARRADDERRDPDDAR